MAIVECDALEDGLASMVLGSPVSPFDAPDMSIWDVVHWVAREGGSKDFDVSDRSVWDAAIGAVVSKLRAGEIPFFGQRSAKAFPEAVPGAVLGGVHIVHPYQGASADADLAQYDGLRLDLGAAEGDRLFAPGSEETRLNLRITSTDLTPFWSFTSKPTGIEGLTEVKTSSGQHLLQGVPTASNRLPSVVVDPGNVVTLSAAPRPSRKTAAGSGRKRGVKPVVFERVAEAMRVDLANGSMTADELYQMQEKALEEKYSASRDTCRKARDAVLLECEAAKAQNVPRT